MRFLRDVFSKTVVNREVPNQFCWFEYTKCQIKDYLKSNTYLSTIEGVRMRGQEINGWIYNMYV